MQVRQARRHRGRAEVIALAGMLAEGHRQAERRQLRAGLRAHAGPDDRQRPRRRDHPHRRARAQFRRDDGHRPIPAGAGNRITGTVTCCPRVARRGGRSRRRPRSCRDGRERGVFLYPGGQHRFADKILPNVLSFLDNLK
jgi:hypothetical protein